MHSTETILFVEDEDSLRIVVSDFLRDLGYQVLTATGGPEALELAASSSNSIDLLISDVTLAPISGPELARRLRASHPAMRVIYVSGYSESVLEQLDGALLQKPFTIKMLTARIREVMDGNG